MELGCEVTLTRLVKNHPVLQAGAAPGFDKETQPFRGATLLPGEHLFYLPRSAFGEMHNLLRDSAHYKGSLRRETRVSIGDTVTSPGSVLVWFLMREFSCEQDSAGPSNAGFASSFLRSVARDRSGSVRWLSNGQGITPGADRSSPESSALIGSGFPKWLEETV
jgi:hypothetical protein